MSINDLLMARYQTAPTIKDAMKEADVTTILVLYRTHKIAKVDCQDLHYGFGVLGVDFNVEITNLTIRLDGCKILFVSESNPDRMIGFERSKTILVDYRWKG